MRSRLSSQIRQQTDICIFCLLRNTSKPSVDRSISRTSSRSYGVSSHRLKPGGQAAAEALMEDDEDDFPLLKDSAGSTWRPSAPKPLATSGTPQRKPQTQRREDSFRRIELNRPTSQEASETILPRTQQQTSRSSERATRWQDRMPNRTRRQDDGSMTPDGTGPRQSGSNWKNRASTRSSLEGVDDGGMRFKIRRFVPSVNDQESTKQDLDGPSIRKVSLNWTPRVEEELGRTHDNHDSKAEREPTQSQTSDKHDLQDTAPPKNVEWTPENLNTIQQQAKAAFEQVLEEEKLDHRELIFKSKFRRHGRLGDDDEDEETVQLPAATAEYKSSRTEVRTKSRTARFDLDEYEAEARFSNKNRKNKRQAKPTQRPTVFIPEYMTVQQLAQTLSVKTDILAQKLEEEGFEGARYDHMLDAETSAMFADIYGFDVVAAVEEMQDLVPRPPPEDSTNLPSRPPIVTIMGHVDHGKTTILDWLRKSSVAAGEHGGITQHIGAFSVTMPGSERQITFLDTPGHEAFLDMRRRGANVTDIVVLVVAADDSVKPQTIEAIKHALDAKVQLIVAINKVDKYDANIDRVKQDLTTHDIVVEDYGGDYQAIAVSGKTGQGMEQLEEAIITLSDVLDLRAEKDGPAEGSIIESKLTAAGRAATVLVRRGTLRVGDFIVAGPTWGRVRTLRNDAGALVKEAYPGDPVQVDGWRGDDPVAGLEVLQAEDEQHAKSVIELRQDRAATARSAAAAAALNISKTQEAEARAKVLAWEADNDIKARRRRHDEGWTESSTNTGPKQVHFVIKADVAGSVEAIAHAISAIGNHEIQAHVVHSGTGPLSESDIGMLSGTGETSYAVSFNQPVDAAISNLAQTAGLEILDHNIIYRVTEAVRDRLQDALPPLVTQKVLGQAEITNIFEYKLKSRKSLKIAGCKISNGTVSKAQPVRVLRGNETVYTGTLESLKNVKKDVTEMPRGSECGMAFTDWTDFQEGDSVQCYEEKIEKRQLY